MAMEINGNLLDYSVKKQNYSSYVAQSMAGNTAAGSAKKKETENTTDYANELAKLVPSVEFRVGNACVSDKSGKSLTVNPKLLEKMQNDPEKEKDMKDMIKGVESMSKLAESIAKATGWTIVYQHGYIDENGKYHCRMQGRNDFMLNMSGKLREERRKNSEKLIEKSKEKATEKREKLQEALEENAPLKKAEQMLLEKLENSDNREIYLDDDDMQLFIDAAKEDTKGKAVRKNQIVAGGNLDMKI